MSKKVFFISIIIVSVMVLICSFPYKETGYSFIKEVNKVLDVKAPKNAGDNPSTTSTADETKVTSAVEDAATKKEEEKMEEINPSDLPFDNWY